MIWWFDNPARARSERQGVAELVERVSWLKGVRWYLSEGLVLSVDFDIEHGSELFPLTMTYVAFFPSAPPIVIPRDGAKLSNHQYGAGGNLCLEYRADNWESTVTGAMMIESAHRLIAGERTIDVELPSAHHVSIGQSARGSSFRFLLTTVAEERLKAVLPGECVEIGIAEKFYSEAITVTVNEIDGVTEIGAWPAGMREIKRRADAIRLPDGKRAPAAKQESIVKLLTDLGLTRLLHKALAPSGDLDLVLVSGNAITHFYAFGAGDKRQFGCSKTFVVPAAKRLPANYVPLAVLHIGLVGCGSLGSKIAAMLARAGIRKFTLVDDDLFFATNLVRNELSGQSVGEHKVDGLRARLMEIAGPIEVTVRRIALGGQESADSTDSVMSALQACDVLIDATADPHCFNFCAAVAKAALRPLIWGEVLAGGIGGIVARVRPGYEPEPQRARNQIMAWCDKQGIPAPVAGSENPYAANMGDRPPLIADDAEVTIIAGHLSRVAIDALLGEESDFPAPAYAIGLRKAWIFSQPFDTHPIQLSGVEPWQAEQDEASADETMAFLRELLPSPSNGNDKPAK
jgi:sulfur-carrier protein adenylyltransferase/sulfurtransferase